MTVTLTPGEWSTALYPGESAGAILEHITEALAWVYFFAPCLALPATPDTGHTADLARSLVKRALRYDKKTEDGSIVSQTAGPFSTTYDNRRTTAPNIFSEKQVEVLKSLCGGQAQFGAVTVPLGAPVGLSGV